MKSQVQLHLGAVRQLLDLCQKEGIPLTGGIKRAVFWLVRMLTHHTLAT